MPRSTFLNLPTEKREGIRNAAIAEFSSCRFSEASINKIVKDAGISRGSFYQYFVDKEDLFRWLLEGISREKEAIVLADPGHDATGDIFAICQSALAATLTFGRAHPAYARLALLMELDTSPFILEIRRGTLTRLRGLIERDQRAGIVRKDIDPDLLADMLYSLLAKPAALDGSSDEEFLRKVGASLAILKRGSSRDPRTDDAAHAGLPADPDKPAQRNPAKRPRPGREKVDRRVKG
jgi:AcrR family transcriptional regulator